MSADRPAPEPLTAAVQAFFDGRTRRAPAAEMLRLITAMGEALDAARAAVSVQSEQTPPAPAPALREAASGLLRALGDDEDRPEDDVSIGEWMERLRAALAASAPVAEGLAVELWADVRKFVRWSANVRDDTAEAIAVAKALIARIEALER